jgi:hypothetical protein
MDIGNRDEILELDLHPEIESRGAHNMEINWRQALEGNQR